MAVAIRLLVVMSPDPLPAGPVAGLLQGLTILVVDDDEDARALLHTVLEYSGAEVVSAASARGALAALAALGPRRPDVIIADLVMPGDDGYALIRAMRTRASVRGVPMIALTAYAFAHSADEVLSAGFNAYLKKPVELWELCRTVARLGRR
jgi:CheY-like chemotaxis protein